MATILSRDSGGGVGRGVVTEDRRAANAEAAGQGLPSRWVETWRKIYTPLLMHSQGTDALLLAVSSALEGEGKTTTSLGLGASIAADLEEQVLLVDLDLASRGLSRALGLDSSPGLGEYLAGATDLKLALRRTAMTNLWVLPAGSAVPNPSRPLRSSTMVSLIARLRKEYRVVILDTPSMLSSSDAMLIASMADSLLLVARAGQSTTSDVTQALALAESVPQRAVIVNDFQSAVPRRLRWLFRKA
jgi:capsular exopolysaccharide synthesis family protein